MGRPEADRTDETDPANLAGPARQDPARALVVIAGGAETRSDGLRAVPRRPLAGFLAQLIVSAEPALRPSRHERTRSAAARYAEAGRRA